MASDEAPVAGRRRSPVYFSARLAREVCRRTAAGETLAAICADPGMPSMWSLQRWAKRRPEFGRILSRARALGERGGKGRPCGYCPVTAREILARVSEGETLAAIARDPEMPSLGTILNWRHANADFEAELQVAREALAEQFTDLGWKLAMEATPQTTFLTRMRLGQLRWTAAVMAPRTHGRLKPVAPRGPPEVTTICFRHFEIEEHPQTGQHRVVGYTPDPDTMRPVRDSEGPWTWPVDPVQKAKDVQALIDADGAGEAGPVPDDPEGWC